MPTKTIRVQAKNLHKTETRYKSQNTVRQIFSVGYQYSERQINEIFIRKPADADERTLPGKVHGELLKMYQKYWMNGTETLRGYCENHLQ